MSVNDHAKRRARRIAADEAHSWARNLRLNNPHAKLVLCMLSQYVNGDGICWVSATALAEDCELALNTVRSRLAWLEGIGAIARRPQWLDEYGRRNGDGRGKRTSDDIVLIIEAEIDLSEPQNDGDSPDNVEPVSPPPGGGLNNGADPICYNVSPPLALRQPPNCVGGLISEPEPESPPKTPSGGESDQDQVLESEPEHFAPAWHGWPGHEVMRRDLALAEFRQLSAEKQLLCRAAVPLFASLQTKLGRTRVPNFHLWIRSRGFDEFPNARLVEPGAPSRVWIAGREIDALAIAMRMADRGEPRLIEDPEHGHGLWRNVAVPADLAALAEFASADPESWHRFDLGTPQFAAWRDRLQAWLGGEIQPERIWLEPFDPAVHALPAMHADFRLRKSAKILRAPAPWPPHRDGTWPIDNSEVA
jgi:hypothetical protein